MRDTHALNTRHVSNYGMATWPWKRQYCVCFEEERDPSQLKVMKMPRECENLLEAVLAGFDDMICEGPSTASSS